MKNREIVQKLNELRKIHIELIDPSRELNYTCGLATNYSELINIIADLLKTSQKALEGIHAVPECYRNRI